MNQDLFTSHPERRNGNAVGMFTAGIWARLPVVLTSLGSSRNLLKIYFEIGVFENLNLVSTKTRLTN